MGLFNSKNRGDESPQDPKSEANRDTDRTDTPTTRNASWKTRSVSADGDSSSTSEAASTDGARRAKRKSGEPDQGARTARPGSPTKQTTKTGEGDMNMATMGQSIVFKGELTGDEDLEIEGNVDGRVSLANHQLTVGPNGRVAAEIQAKSIVVIGQVNGNLTASERIEVQATGVVNGDLRAPSLNVQEGAVLNGSIEMTTSGAPAAKKPATPSSSASPSPSASAPPPSA